MKRWYSELSKALPTIDVADALKDTNNLRASKKRQFAPEYSQKCYMTMLREEQAIGNYIDIPDVQQNIVDRQSRKYTVQLIQSLNQLKNYKETTLYLAISLADRYLVNLVIRFEQEPVDFSYLAVASLFVAAKLEQPFRPSLERLM